MCGLRLLQATVWTDNNHLFDANRKKEGLVLLFDATKNDGWW